MDAKKIIAVVHIYRKKLKGFNRFGEEVDHTLLAPQKYEAIDHCRAMLDDLEEFAKAGRIEKAFRWLGFVQGCLWSEGIYTIEELKNHNRPDKAKNLQTPKSSH